MISYDIYGGLSISNQGNYATFGTLQISYFGHCHELKLFTDGWWHCAFCSLVIRIEEWEK